MKPPACVHNHVADDPFMVVEIELFNPSEVAVLGADRATNQVTYTSFHNDSFPRDCLLP